MDRLFENYLNDTIAIFVWYVGLGGQNNHHLDHKQWMNQFPDSSTVRTKCNSGNQHKDYSAFTAVI